MTIKISDSAYIRHYTPTDKENLFSLVNSNREHLDTFLAWPKFTKTSEDSLSFINSTLKDGINKCLVWGIFEDETLCGTVGFNSYSTQNKTVEIGYWIGSRFQGRGLMTNAVKALLNIAFTRYNCNRVSIQCSTLNKSSANIPKRLGFTFEGVLRQIEVVGENVYDHNIYSLLKSEYKP
jgi:ribosomal-protein-serine acetyltransferase